ncbi:MAG: alpha/beta hydrolase [Spirochaetes bacterium]|nr:alpha/beta hydrolase [Spirochaetota bacterium]
MLIDIIGATPADASNYSKIVLYNGEKIRINYKYRRAGKELLLFIHGLACTKESFDDAWKQKSLKKYSLLSVDLPGFGKSGRPKKFSYTLDDHAGVMFEFIRPTRFKKIHLIGHSMGGAIAILLAQKDPQRFLTIISVDGCLGGTNNAPQQQTTAPTFTEFTIKLKSRLEKAKGTPLEKGYRLWYEWSRFSDPIAFQKSDESLIKMTRSGKIAEVFFSLPMKKIYFYPQYDGMPAILSKASNVKTIQISNSGHFIMNDNPNEFYQKLAKEISQ